MLATDTYVEEETAYIFDLNRSLADLALPDRSRS